MAVYGLQLFLLLGEYSYFVWGFWVCIYQKHILKQKKDQFIFAEKQIF